MKVAFAILVVILLLVLYRCKTEGLTGGSLLPGPLSSIMGMDQPQFDENSVPARTDKPSCFKENPFMTQWQSGQESAYGLKSQTGHSIISSVDATGDPAIDAYFQKMSSENVTNDILKAQDCYSVMNGANARFIDSVIEDNKFQQIGLNLNRSTTPQVAKTGATVVASLDDAEYAPTSSLRDMLAK